MNDKAERQAARVWTEDAQTKIQQTTEYPAKTGKVLRIAAARNEYRGAQIEVFALRDILGFDVTVSDLVGGSGIVAKEDISVFVEKYTRIRAKSNSIPEFLSGARIPDALIPLEAVRAKGEDSISARHNQGFYVDIWVRENIPAGLYRGSATVRLDDWTTEVPVELKVYDFTVPSITPTQNYWGMFDRSESLRNELDTSDEMAEAYYELMLKYRMNCELLPFSGAGGPDRYVELLRKYYRHYGFSTYKLPTEYKEDSYDGEAIDFDAEAFIGYIVAIARASMEDKIDYLDKALVYFTFSSGIDEPQTKENYEKCRRFSKVYGALLRDIDARLKTEFSSRPDYSYYTQTIAPTLLKMPMMLTLCHVRHYWEIQDYDVGNFTYCPVAHALAFPRLRRSIREQSDTCWWYTCTGPVYPYPSTHIDDYAVSMRLIGWMQKAYRLQGYLNWAAAINARLEYPYENPDIGFSNGDGWVLYAGRYYGIYGPVPSLRAVAFRDGMQDYCYLDMAEKNSDESGKAIIGRFYDELFDNTRVLVTDASLLDSFRDELAKAIAGGKMEFEERDEWILLDDCTSAETTIIRSNSKYEPRIETGTDGEYSAKGKSVKVNLQGTLERETFFPRIFVEARDINGGDFSEIKSLRFKIYGTTEKPTPFTVYALDEVNKTILYETEIERGLNVVTVPLRWQLDKPLKIIMFETDNYYDETGPRLFYVDEVSMLCTGRERKDTATEPRADGMRLDDIEMLWGSTNFGRLSLTDECSALGKDSLKIEIRGDGKSRSPELERPGFTVSGKGDYTKYTHINFDIYNASDCERPLEFFVNSREFSVSRTLVPGENHISILLSDCNADLKRVRFFGLIFEKYETAKSVQVYYMNHFSPSTETQE